jgi:arsenite efflux ATP-binding protein ArsA (TC 3.A.4.1.1)
MNRLTPAPDADESGRGARYLRDSIEVERERLQEARESIDPPIVATIESRVREVKGDILDSVAAELDINPG